MKKPAKLGSISTLMMCLCILGIFIPVITARDAFSPSWLKEGVYAKYDPSHLAGIGDLGYIQFFNVTESRFAGTNYTLSQKADTISTISSSFMWRCVSVNATMAKLQVTLDYTGKPGANFDDYFEYVTGSSENVSFQLTGEAYVDLYTRGVYNVDGVYLGTTHLWLPANPNNGQEITIWEEDNKTITTPVSISDEWITTAQGKQDIFEIRGTRVKDQYTMGSPIYDLDTGLCVSGEIHWDPICAAIGISRGTVGGLCETNINLGPERSTINWNQTLYYAIIPIAVILLVTTLLIKRKRKKN